MKYGGRVIPKVLSAGAPHMARVVVELLPGKPSFYAWACITPGFSGMGLTARDAWVRWSMIAPGRNEREDAELQLINKP